MPLKISKQKLPSLQGQLVVDTYRGALRVRAWPKQRGKPKSAHTRYMNRWFADAMRKIKYVNSQTMHEAIILTKQTGLYPRDVIMKASQGGLYKIADPDLGLLTFKRQGLREVAFQGTIVEQTAPQALPTNTLTLIVYPLPLVDSAGMWDPGPPNRVVIPAGVNIVNVTVRQGLAGSGVNRNWAFIRKNGGPVMAANESGDANTKYVSASTGAIPVVQGDYFEHFAQSNGADSTFNPTTGMSVEILDAEFPPAT